MTAEEHQEKIYNLIDIAHEENVSPPRDYLQDRIVYHSGQYFALTGMLPIRNRRNTNKVEK